jgi:chloramphenicol-sensitive protein RarD
LKPQPEPSTVISSGALYAILAYSSWGLLPIYWKLFGQVPAVEVLSHRIFWSLLFLLGLLAWQRRGVEFRQLQQSPQKILFLLITALLLTFNWGLYIYGVNSDRVIETSLGYFINPLMNVLLGLIFLKERLHWGQQLAVALATLGVLNFVWQLGSVPWIALGLALSFALYGLGRKVVPVSPLVGLAAETMLMVPLALAYIIYAATADTGNFGVSSTLTLLFIGAGVVTSLPLLWFNNAAKRLRLSTLGFFQYIAPSVQLVLGVFIYREPFTHTHAVTFGLIWLALFTYSTTSMMRHAAVDKT